MARPLSDPQRREVAEFVTGLYRLGGYATQREFAEDAGYHPVNLSDVMGAKAGIDGLNLLRLIKAAARRAGLPVEEAATRVIATPLTVEQETQRVRLLETAMDALQKLREADS